MLPEELNDEPNESMVKSENDLKHLNSNKKTDVGHDAVANDNVNNLLDPPEGDDEESERQSPLSIHRSSIFKNRFGFASSPANFMRSRSDARPMNATKRFWKRAIRLLLCQREPEALETKQVRVPPREEKGSFVDSLTSASEGSLTRLSNWLLQLKFLSVIGLFLVFYMVIIFMFCLVLGLAINRAYTKVGATCCEQYEFTENTFANNFGVVFELSWTVSDSLLSLRGLVVFTPNLTRPFIDTYTDLCYSSKYNFIFRNKIILNLC